MTVSDMKNRTITAILRELTSDVNTTRDPDHPALSRKGLPAYCGCCGCVKRYCICSCCCGK